MEQKLLWPGWDTVRVIGSGGYGKVYEIRKVDSTGEYRAALKILSIPASPDEYNSYRDDGYNEESITSIFKSKLEDVTAEFKLMSQFKGVSNIVSYEEHMIVPHEDGRGWDILIRMELLTSLPSRCNEKMLTESEIVKLGIDICRALELCAKKSIIHRDIKPQNIFVNDFGDYKLGDFGIARTMEHTMRATKAGTYNYMAPEIYTGKPYNATVDIYSLGLVLYWLLNQRRLPFLPLDKVPTAGENNEAQARRLGGEAVPPPCDGSNALKAVVLKACAYEPSMRYQNAEKMRAALFSVTGSFSQEPAARGNAAGRGDETCPWCNGTGRENTLSDDLYSYTSTPCLFCQGTGKLASGSHKEDIPLYLLQTAEHTAADPSCPACHGNGWLHLGNGRPFPCPFCATASRSASNNTDPTAEDRTRGIFDRTYTAHDKAQSHATTYYCIKCGTPVANENLLCPTCQQSEQAEQSASVPDTLVCPHCRGTKVQTFLKGKHYYDDICGVCHGVGAIKNDEQGRLLQKSYDDIRRQAKIEGIASLDCPLCHGMGQVITLSQSLFGVMQVQNKCPLCYGGHNLKKYRKTEPPKDRPKSAAAMNTAETESLFDAASKKGKGFKLP